MASLSPLFIGTVVAVGLGAAAVVLWVEAYRRRSRGRRGSRRGLRAQREAARLLRDRGYEIVGVEERIAADLEVDGELSPYEVRLDYLVRRAGRLWAVEVKSGQAADLRRPGTRRQLREYASLLGVDGLLFVDMATKRLQRVRFPELSSPRSWRWLAWLLIGLSLGFALGVFVSLSRPLG